MGAFKDFLRSLSALGIARVWCELQRDARGSQGVQLVEVRAKLRACEGELASR